VDAIKTTQCNKDFGKPVDWGEKKHGSCGSLPVHQILQPGGMLRLRSFWRPTAAELAALNDGAVVALNIYGYMHPPVSLQVEYAEEVTSA
jgi:hypothetical protein